MLALAILVFMTAPKLFAENDTSQKEGHAEGTHTQAEGQSFIPDDMISELREKNIKTIKKWLTFRGASRHKDRLTVYTEDYINGNPFANDPSMPVSGRSEVEAQAAIAAENPENDMFKGWHFYNATIYAAVDNPNLFSVNCLGKGTVVTKNYPKGFTYQNRYTHYFKMKDGLIQVWWETIIDTPPAPGSETKSPWEDPDYVMPPMVTFYEGEVGHQ